MQFDRSEKAHSGGSDEGTDRNDSELLREDGELSLRRRNAEGILLLAPVHNAPAPRVIERLSNEYLLRDELDTAWAVVPLALRREQGRPVLFLGDPGGELLTRFVGQPCRVAEFLRFAIGIALALGRMHDRGLIHKDIKPDHVFVDAATGAAWLTGFGIASRATRERQDTRPPEMIAGSLPFMAPEQTGRMNRSLDSRADLYSYGILLYQLLTGELPFAASDPIGWIHCHIARQPVAPGDRVRGIPATLSAIVMRLLAKPAEDRYQTAAGVEADLRRCLAAWEATGKIESFRLAAHDVPKRLLIPETLYGREQSIAALRAAFDRVATEGKTELVLVSGYSGIGKSSVVNELQKALSLSEGIFASGKCEQYKRDIPYATLAQALQALVLRVLRSSEAELARWREAIVQAVHPNGQLIVSLIPELELVIGNQPAVPDLPPQDSRNRFQMVFRSFLQVFARPEHPLVLFLDDLQWIDAATLALVEDLVGQSETRHLLLIGAYRDNEVGPSHPLVLALDGLRRTGTRVHDIVLSALALEDVGRLIAGALHCDEERVRPLAALVFEKTGGNPFFTIQFLTELAAEGLLSFDTVTAGWTWDVARIGAKGYTDNVVQLMVVKLKRLPAAAQEALKELACLGINADFATLAIVRECPEEEIHSAFADATRAGLLFRLEAGYRFAHDRVQEAAYALIPQALRPELHLRIGRRLRAAGDSESTGERVFAIVNQLNQAVDLIVDVDEKTALLRLNVLAGVKAKAGIAYGAARAYLAQAAALVAADAWTQSYDETLEFHLAFAECEYLVGNFDAADRLFELMLRNARSDLDRARIYSLQMKVYQAGSRYDESIVLLLKALQLFGVVFPQSDDEIQATADEELRTISANLAGRRIGDLLDAPMAEAPEVRAIIDLLCDAAPSAYIARPKLFPLVTMKAVNFSLRHGHTDQSSYAYAVHGLTLVAVYGELAQAYEFTEMALRLNEKLNNARLRGTLLHLHGDHVNCWRRHFETAVPILDQAFRACLEVGDLVYAGYLAFQIVWWTIERGIPLAEAHTVAVRKSDFARQSHSDAIYQTIELERQFIASLQGRTSDPLEFDADGFDERASLATFETSFFGCGPVFHQIMKQILAFLHGRLPEALDAARKAEPLLGATMAMPIEATHHFFHALTLTALYPDAPPDEQAQFAGLLDGKLKKLKLWSDNCPENYRNRYALVLAEMARIEGRPAEAMDLYEEAIQSARDNGFVHNEALALEVAAEFYAKRGLATFAHAYRKKARYGYLRWGAESKVRQLDAAYPQLRDETPEPRSASAIAAPIEQLDLGAVVKMSQALSGEIVLGRLVEALLTIALEYAGAERGLLILVRGDEQRIEAEAVIGSGNDGQRVEVHLRQASIGPAELPVSMLNYVTRACEVVLLDDASLPNPHSADRYFAQKPPRSVLCLPLLKQGKLIGALYLENTLTPRVFTADRIAILKLLTSQAAISLENARLYAELQDMAGALRHSEERYALVMEATGEGFWDWLIGSDQIYVSPRMKEMYAMPPEATFATRDEFIAQVPFHPEDKAKWQQALEAHFAGETERFDIDIRMLPRGEQHWLHVTGLLKRDAAGHPVRWNGTVSDITARKAAQEELLTLERQLRQAQRLEAMGTLAGGIAHDFNNILGAILGYGEMTLRAAPRGSRLRRDLDSIMTAAERGRALVDRILAFSRSGVSERIPVHVEAVVRDAIEMTSATLPAGITVDTRLNAGRAAIMGDPTQVDQVLMNLVSNALHAMAAGGTLRVSLDVASFLTPRLATTATIDDGEYVVLEVADSGTGMPSEILERIFDPFFTTKEVGVGTGLGLSLVHGIVSELGGAIDVASTPDAGSVFTVYLPRAGDAVEAEQEIEEIEWPRGDRQQILVVDDEESLVRLTTDNLTDLGYVPVGFTSSRAALEAFHAHPERYDAVITDERMSGMTGTALIREMRSIDATIPALLVSGFMGGDVAARAKAAGADDVLKKPVSMHALATTLARVLRR